MRWDAQAVDEVASPPALLRLSSVVRSVQTPEFEGVTFHEVLARSALNHVPESSLMLPGAWTINPYRGCSHACLYCYARSTHRYLDLDTGADFDRQIVVKTNVVEVLERELATRKAPPGQVALGTNTDPYQRAEGRYALMPGIIAALARHRVPFSILTKGTLLRRDLPLLAEVNQSTPVSVAMSIAVFDDQLQRLLEPGTPSTAARLATVRQVRAAGLDCAVFLAPVLPALTDSTAQLDDALGQLKAAGATSVFFTSLRLGPDVRELFLAWLAREHPALVPRYEQLYARGARAAESYRRVLQARMSVLLRRHGLRDGAELTDDPAQGSAGRFSLSPRGVREAAGASAGGLPGGAQSAQPAPGASVASPASPAGAGSVGTQPQLF